MRKITMLSVTRGCRNDAMNRYPVFEETTLPGEQVDAFEEGTRALCPQGQEDDLAPVPSAKYESPKIHRSGESRPKRAVSIFANQK